MTIDDVLDVMDYMEKVAIICGAREEDEEDESLVFRGTIRNLRVDKELVSRIGSEEVSALYPTHTNGDDMLVIYFEGYDFYPTSWREEGI